MKHKKLEKNEKIECPIRDVLDRLGEKWSVLIILTLENKVLRFSEVKTAIGDISQRMLTLTLRNLERDGLVQRKIYPTVPPKVEYKLSELGQIFHEEVKNLVGWALKFTPEIETARKRYDKRKNLKRA